MGTLYIVATPLGNLEDITLRALRILGEVSLIVTEDTRTTGRLLKHFDISCPMISYHEHNKEKRLERVLEALDCGDVALVSEAGTPLISDPGYKLVQAAIAEEINIVSVPGANALTASLPVSGLPVDRFLFLGFLPRKSGDRRRLLAEVKSQQATLVFFEAPHRLRPSLADTAEILGPDRAITVCRELTKLHEEVWRGNLAEAIQEWANRKPRGEFTLVVAGALPPTTWTEQQVKAALIEATAAGITAKAAVQQVTEQSGWPKRDVYALVHKIKKMESQNQE